MIYMGNHKLLTLKGDLWNIHNLFALLTPLIQLIF